MIVLLFILSYFLIGGIVFTGLYINKDTLPASLDDNDSIVLAGLLWPMAIIGFTIIKPIVFIFLKYIQLLDKYNEHKKKMKNDKEYALRYKMKKVFK